MCGSRVPVVCSRRLRGQVGAVSLAVGIAGRCACLGGALNRSGFSGDFGIVPRRSVQKCRKTRAPYPAEFRAEMVHLVRSGRTPGELSREFEPSDQTIRNWVNQADIDDGRKEGLTTGERDELRRLRRENRIPS